MSNVTIVAAAMEKFGATVSLPRPARHHTIIHMLADNGVQTPVTGKQGFLTSEGEFVDRYEARKIALASGQVTEDKLHHHLQLFSEDLW